MGKTKVLLVAALLSLAFSGLAGADYMIGDKGSEVSMLQRRLTQAGFKVDDDGVYGQSTANAGRMFQRKRHLDQDGVVGSLTYRELTGRTMPKIKSGIAAENDNGNTGRGITQKNSGSPKVLKASGSNGNNGKKQKKTAKKLDSGKLKWDDSTSQHKTPSAKEQKIMAEARKYLGVPYRFGGTDTSGFDCSGFIRYIFGRHGIDLPHSSDAQYSSYGRFVSIDSLEPGDLVFFTTYNEGVSHSGIYVGNGNFISATTSNGIALANMKSGYWFDHYVGAKRIL